MTPGYEWVPQRNLVDHKLPLAVAAQSLFWRLGHRQSSTLSDHTMICSVKMPHHVKKNKTTKIPAILQDAVVTSLM